MTQAADDDNDESEELWNEFQNAKDPYSRETLLIRLAESSLVDHDFSDLEIPEHVHRAFGEMRAVQAQYEVAALVVGRMVAQYMERAVLLPLSPEDNPN